MERKLSKSIICALKPLDWLMILLGLAICTISILAATTQKEGTPLLLVSSPTAEYLYPLDKDDTIQIQGLEGITEISRNIIDLQISIYERNI